MDVNNFKKNHSLGTGLFFNGLCFNERAVSPIIGTALVLAILVTTITFMQRSFVPVWNAQYENEHFDKVYEDITMLSSSLENAAVSEIPRSSPVRLGLTYPSRLILYNPKPSLYGTITINPDLNINISYTKLSGGTSVKTYNSTSLKYELPGMHPYIVYEHGIIIRDYSKFNLPNSTSSQPTIIDRDNINLPFIIINGSGYSITSVESRTIPVYPVRLNAQSDTIFDLNYVNITLETHYPDAWRHVLNNTANTSKTKSFVSGNKVYINTSTGDNASGIAIKLPDYLTQAVQMNRLYAGMISAGNLSSIGLATNITTLLLPYTGAGEESLSIGTSWNDVPSPDTIKGFNITNITTNYNCIDAQGGQCKLDNNVIGIRLVDTAGHFWFITVELSGTSASNQKIKQIKARSLNSDTPELSTKYVNYPFNVSTKIDLLSAFTGTNYGRYNQSNITMPNSMALWMGDTGGNADPTSSPLIYYRLVIE